MINVEIGRNKSTNVNNGRNTSQNVETCSLFGRQWSNMVKRGKKLLKKCVFKIGQILIENSRKIVEHLSKLVESKFGRNLMNMFENNQEGTNSIFGRAVLALFIWTDTKFEDLRKA